MGSKSISQPCGGRSLLLKRGIPFFLCFFLAAETLLPASYNLSLGSYPPQQAEALHNQLTAHGYPVYLLYGEEYEIRMGSYGTMEEAEQVAEKLKTDQKIAVRILIDEEWDQAQFNWGEEDEGREVDREMLQGYSDPRAQKIVSLGLDLFGQPYKYGGQRVGKGIDCSYFVKLIFKQLGIDLPRTSRDQFKVGTPVETSDLKVGDLLFFKKTYRVRYRKGKQRKYRYVTRINHVGIYIGNSEFIHATRNVNRVTISRITDAYFVKRFAGARRVLTPEDQGIAPGTP